MTKGNPNPRRIPAAEQLERLRAEVEVLRARHLRATQTETAQAETIEEMRKALRRAQQLGRREIEEISRAVSRFLPRDYPVMGGLSVVAQCRPCHDFGGDFYDAVPLADGRVAVSMADVAGHGASAMIAMATARALLHAALHEAKSPDGPAAILLRLSRWMQNQLEADQFVTMWLALWNPADEILRFSSAAHPPAIHWPEERDPHYLTTPPGLPLGLAGIEPQPYEECALSLALFDRVFLYTDGWNESASATGDVLDAERFLDFVSNAYQQPLHQVPVALFTLLERHAANAQIRDDVSLLVFDRVR